MSDGTEPTAIADDYAEASARRAGREATLGAGDFLNGIYKVERFIARGGMGEVFEGVNIETDERVAIKAIRSHLASDPKIIAMFRKEARLLTHIAHPAIVQYRVFARDPLLDLHYIVTDFINGEPITAHFDGDPPSIGDVVTLGRRLAAGLEAAHDHGAIHRDMSPDNVLLPEGKIERAKIIDFGIAKSLDITGETVVGDGFAGKLGYVAPEQFGDFGRQIGPWTDIYSSALVLLAYARGKAPPMGTTLSEAVERRRAGPDVTDLPLALAPLLERMLLPDPAARIQSMREVLVGLDGVRLPDDVPILVRSTPMPAAIAPAYSSRPLPVPEDMARDGAETSTDPVGSEVVKATMFAPAAELPAIPVPAKPLVERAEAAERAAPTKAVRPAAAAQTIKAGSPSARRRGRRWLYLALPAVGAVAVAAVALHRAPDAGPVAPASSEQRAPAAPMAAPQLSAADRASRLNTLLAKMPCTWVSARPTSEEGATALSGGTGDLGAVSNQVSGYVQALGSVETGEILPVNIAQCRAIDALRPFRIDGIDRDAGTLFLSASNVVLGEGSPGCPRAATAEITVANYDPQTEFALVLLQPDGQLLQIAGTREEFARAARQKPDRFNIGADGAYHASVCYGLAGSAAVLLIESSGAIDLGFRTGVPGLPPADFAQRVAEQGRSQQMRIFAEWVRIEQGQPGVAETTPEARTASGTVVSPAPAATPVPGRATNGSRLDARVRAATDTADANRLELERIKALRNGVRERGGGKVNCWAFDGRWKDLGEFGRNECVARAIRGHCQVSFAKYKNYLYRRQDGNIQRQQGSRWKDVAVDSDC